MSGFAYSVPGPAGETSSSASRPGTATAPAPAAVSPPPAHHQQHMQQYGTMASSTSRSNSTNSDTASASASAAASNSLSAGGSTMHSRLPMDMPDYAGAPPRSSGGLPSASTTATTTTSSSFADPSTLAAFHGHPDSSQYSTYSAPHPPRSSGGLPSYLQNPPGSSHGAATGSISTSAINGTNNLSSSSNSNTNNTSSSTTNLWGYSVPSPPQTAQSQSLPTGAVTAGPPGTAGSTSHGPTTTGFQHFPLQDQQNQASAALAAAVAMPSTSGGHPPYHGYNLSNT